MTLRHLLDTDIVSDLTRHPQSLVASRITTIGEEFLWVDSYPGGSPDTVTAATPENAK